MAFSFSMNIKPNFESVLLLSALRVSFCLYCRCYNRNINGFCSRFVFIVALSPCYVVFASIGCSAMPYCSASLLNYNKINNSILLSSVSIYCECNRSILVLLCLRMPNFPFPIRPATDRSSVHNFFSVCQVYFVFNFCQFHSVCFVLLVLVPFSVAASISP